MANMTMIVKEDRVEEAEEGYGWSELPGELLALIDQRIIKLKYAIRFRAVCKRWRKTLAELQPVIFRQSSKLPLLILPYCNDNNNAAARGCGSQEEGCQCRLFLDIAHNQYHHIEFVEGFERTTLRGLAFGWLFMVQLPIPVLLNPLTGKQIAPPSITSCPDVLEYHPSKVGSEYVLQSQQGFKMVAGKNYMESMYILRTAISADPVTSSRDDECIVMAIRQTSNRRLACCKLGGDEWTFIPHPDSHPAICFENIVLWRNQFYVIDTSGQVFCCDLSNDAPTMARSAFDVARVRGTSYLLVGPADELMMVTKIHNFEQEDGNVEDEEDAVVDGILDDYDHGVELDVGEGDGDGDGDGQLDPDGVEYITDLDSDGEVERFGTQNYWSTGFRVYRLNEDTNQWDAVHSIGDFALFLDFNTPTYLSTKDYPGFESNCIYLTDDAFYSHRRRIYHISNYAVEPFFSSSLYKPRLVWPPPVWILP